jgi:hypothetical protein
MWTIDVTLSDHDAVKVGILSQRVCRIHLSTADFPDPIDAEVMAALMAMTIHPGMATKVQHCI